MKTVLVYSGGLDSTVLLYDLLAKGVETHALSIHYGQRHRRELDAAATICKELKVEHQVLELPQLQALFGDSSLTNTAIPVPSGHYAAENMKSTVVPNRNMILLSLATSWAIALKADSVSYAAHSGDHTIYPDCRPEFAETMNQAIGLADWHALRLDRQFVDTSKADIVKLGIELGVPFDKTWSCYQGGELHCGRCGTCLERREAFYLNGIKDPTVYAPDAPSLESLIANNWNIDA
ncbi:MAG: 7-cyano-7-deazaguanine synthase QueC [Opitutales bacterium]|nr:7-cyano-7-deazaguanine synthase QueC [Opitutales bacterium]